MSVNFDDVAMENILSRQWISSRWFVPSLVRGDPFTRFWSSVIIDWVTATKTSVVATVGRGDLMGNQSTLYELYDAMVSTTPHI